jgi:DNA-directed RNA polymerase subunit K/omega|tara:strand:+ start:265 stop:537 length:273 start_codon:yes stop_codon:yes gene_type:complete
MNIDAIPISVLFKDNEDLYEKIVVGAKRQRQIINSRSLQLEAFQDIEDTEQLDKFDDIDHDIDKPLSIAMEELLSNELDWRYSSDEEESK